MIGNYREEHLFALAQAVALYDTYHAQRVACNARIEQYVVSLERTTEDTPPPPGTLWVKPRQTPKHNQPRFDARTYLYQLTGVDLTRIDGIEAGSARALLAAIGTAMQRWKTTNHFVSWVGLCPIVYRLVRHGTEYVDAGQDALRAAEPNNGPCVPRNTGLKPWALSVRRPLWKRELLRSINCYAAPF